MVLRDHIFMANEVVFQDRFYCIYRLLAENCGLSRQVVYDDRVSWIVTVTGRPFCPKWWCFQCNIWWSLTQAVSQNRIHCMQLCVTAVFILMTENKHVHMAHKIKTDYSN